MVLFLESLYRSWRKVRFLSNLPGRIVAVEGIDQSGKRTQTRLLANRLKRTGAKTSTISFPIYDSPSGHQIRSYLEGKQDYSPEALHMLFSLNRWESSQLIDKQLNSNDFVIADRYTPSNLAYGVSRGLSLRWLLELDKGLPVPSLVVVLDVPIQSSFARKSKNRDVHEKNEKFLAEVKRTYRILARRLGWRIVDGRRPVSEVHAAIWKLVVQKFSLDKNGWGAKPLG